MPETKKQGRPRHDDILTPGEWRIVNAIRHGMTSREIARKRGISIDAVKYHVTNILQKLNLSNRKQLRNWAGIARDSVLLTGESILNIKDTKDEKALFIQIGQISRNVKNISVTCKWYVEVLGLKELFSFGDMAFFECQGVRILLQETEDDLSSESIIYFQVEDIQAACAKMKSSGVVFLNAPHKIHTHANGTEEWMAFFNDPDERPLAIMSRVQSKTATT
ncbi:MAG: hypothetical protein COA47_09180 [Robiginitomaculum sp.]|nr:MAG: hypothetical protein COA47_09180 [Robiginitomaculum sp.]